MNSENGILGCDVEEVKNVDIGEQLSGVSMVIKCVHANTSKPSSNPNQDRLDALYPLTIYRYLTLRRKSRTPSPSDMLISWARPLLASTAITLRSSESGIPESAFGTGGFEISYNVRIVFNCPVDVACKDRNPQGGRRGGGDRM
jgi:hypothetical protein